MAERMTAEEAAEWGKTLDFPTVWAALMESRERFDKMGERFDQRIDKLAITVDKMGERIDKLAIKVDQTTENINGLSDSVGKFMETMVSAGLLHKFGDLGYDFTELSQNRKFTADKRVLAEADAFLESGMYAMAVEVKTKLLERHVNDHVERMSAIREYMNRHGDKRTLIGAVAGGIVSESVIKYAQKRGFYVIVQNGDAVEIEKSPSNFNPTKWQ